MIRFERKTQIKLIFTPFLFRFRKFKHTIMCRNIIKRKNLSAHLPLHKEVSGQDEIKNLEVQIGEILEALSLGRN